MAFEIDMRSQIDKTVIAFFVLTYGISWPLFGVCLFLFPGNMVLQGTLGTIAVFGPVSCRGFHLSHIR
jgi:hypothetical protein